MKNILLIGFAGTGKSALGRMLAKQLDYSFIDTDEVIEDLCDTKIRDMVRGRNKIRLLSEERLLFSKIAKSDRQVIAYGCPVFCPEVLDIAAKDAFTVLLYSDAKTVFARVRKRGNSVLLGNCDSYETFETYMSERNEVYKNWADTTISMSDDDINIICDRVYNIYRQYNDQCNDRYTDM